jgi:hypothetical protein
MPQIIFFCPPVSVINGGIRHIFRMAETLNNLGYDAAVFEQSEKRPGWFSSTAPLVGQGVFHPDRDQVYVLPEDQPHILADFKSFPQRKIIYSQNHFYAALGVGDADSYAHYGVTHILCSSRVIYDHVRLRHPKVQASIIPCVIDTALFKPAITKQNTIVYIPRKRKIEAIYIRDMFRFSFPQYRHWNWHELVDKNETDLGLALGEAAVFLSLSRLEGFGLTPLEAMAAGCVVAGFTGLGGREYANDTNGFWVGEDDFPACIDRLKQAVDYSVLPGKATADYRQACLKTIAAYTPEKFTAAVKKSWETILSN